MSGEPEDVTNLSTVKRALLALEEMRDELETLKRADREPVAIIGMSCRFPGAATPEAFWELLREGGDTITEIPAERWNVDDYYHPDPTLPGKTNTRWGGFLEHVDQFDPYFFGISPREAIRMDPQQRLTLEVAWEALEDAGQVAEHLSGSQTGVFIGIYNSDYSLLQLTDVAHIDAYYGTGAAHCIAANRLSYLLNLRGPSMAIDTTCSSSLVAVHLACQSLRNGECDLALAGGVNLMLSPLSTISAAKVVTMAADGRCKTFDARADGIVRGEGCGVVILKRLSDALAGGDRILALIRGSAVNQDGRSNGLTAPSVICQQLLIQQALKNAGVSPSQISYVEAHGTGTPLGDPIEVEALEAVFGAHLSKERPCAIGSVKTNIGHTEAAAGIAGLIKVVLCLQHRAIPPHLHFKKLNPNIPPESFSFEIPTSLRQWGTDPGGRFAGVSAFSLGGTNAHVVLEEAPTPSESEQPDADLAPGRARAGALAHTWHRRRFWLDAHAYRQAMTALVIPSPAETQNGASHPLLGRKLRTALGIYEGLLSLEALPYLAHHQINGKVVLSAAAYLEIGLAAATQIWGPGTHAVESLDIKEVLVLAEGQVRTTQLVLTPEREGETTFQLFCLEGEEKKDASWKLHTSGKIRRQQSPVELTLERRDSLEVVRGRMKEELSIEAFNYSLRERGFDCGSEPQVIRRLWRAGLEALGHLQLPTPLTDEARDYQVHPLMLDAAIRVLGATLPEEGAKTDSYFTAEVGSFLYDGCGDTEMWSHAAIRPCDNLQRGGVIADIQLFDGAGRRVGEITGLRLTPLRRQGHPPQEDFRDWLYEVKWLSQSLEERTPASAAAVLPSAAEIAGRIQTQVMQASADSGLDAYQRMKSRLDSLCADYLVKALNSAGWQMRKGQSVTAEELAERLGVAKPRRRLVRRLLEILQEEEVLEKEGLGWVVKRVPEIIGDTEKRRQALVSEYGFCEPELTLLRRCGENLAEVLKGRCDPLELLFADGTLATVEKLYQDAPFARMFNLLVQKAVAAVMEHLPGESRLRVMEIGAGTGGTTSYVLPELPAGRTEYLFTDVSSLFKLRAQRRFREYPFVKYQLLDIELDPQQQGVCAHQFDLILAANVLHATSDLRQTLNHVRQLLADGGLLMLVEGTAPQRWADLTFGLTEGWWKFRDAEIRRSHPLLSQRGWLKLLKEVGFTDVQGVPETADGQEETSLQGALILARSFHSAEELRSVKAHSSERKIQTAKTSLVTREQDGRWIILSDEGGVGSSLAGRLRTTASTTVMLASRASRGAEFALLEDGSCQLDPCNPSHYDLLLHHAARTHGGTWRGIIHLWSLDQMREGHTLSHSRGEGADDADAFATALRVGCGSVLQLVQAVSRWERVRPAAAPPRLWVVTRGAQSIGGERVVRAWQSAAWGLGRVVSVEQPQLWGGMIDVEEGEGAEAQAAQVAHELFGAWRGEEAAYRGGRRYVARLMRTRHVEGERAGAVSGQETEGGRVRLRSDGTYLVTGGLGGLGRRVARWMVERGAGRVVLVGRRELSAQQQSAVVREVLSGAGVEVDDSRVVIRRVDVSERAEVRSLVAEINERMPQLRGVVHAAGVVEDGVVARLGWEQFARVLRPKAAGRVEPACGDGRRAVGLLRALLLRCLAHRPRRSGKL